MRPVGCHGFSPYSISNFSDATSPIQLLRCNFSDATSLMQLLNQSILNPRNQPRSASSGGGADSDSICKEIEAEDVRAMTPSGRLTVMDSALTPNAPSPIQLLQCNFSDATSLMQLIQYNFSDATSLMQLL